MLLSIAARTSRVLPVRRAAAASVAQREGWMRNFQSSSRVEADSMGKLIESGKEGAEFVVSGKQQQNPFVVFFLAFILACVGNVC